MHCCEKKQAGRPECGMVVTAVHGRWRWFPHAHEVSASRAYGGVKTDRQANAGTGRMRVKLDTNRPAHAPSLPDPAGRPRLALCGLQTPATDGPTPPSRRGIVSHSAWADAPCVRCSTTRRAAAFIHAAILSRESRSRGTGARSKAVPRAGHRSTYAVAGSGSRDSCANRTGCSLMHTPAAPSRPPLRLQNFLQVRCEFGIRRRRSHPVAP